MHAYEASGGTSLATKILLKVARLLSQRLRQTSGQLVDYLEG
ncbi:MAG: hypothetical protein Q8S05_00390 [Sulfuricella sp.]|nr:hypothetical protein [Sulfuricella sp.]